MRENRKRILDIKTGNGMIVHVEEESDVLCGMRTNQRRHKANEDDMTYTVDMGGGGMFPTKLSCETSPIKICRGRKLLMKGFSIE